MAKYPQVLDSRTEQAARGDWSYIEYIDRLLAEEMAARKERSLRTRTRLARLPRGKTLGNFGFEGLDLDPFSLRLFVYCNRKRDKLKILQWEHNAFWPHYCRLERGKFQWSDKDSTAGKPVGCRKWRWLLDGLSLNESTHPDVKA